MEPLNKAFGFINSGPTFNLKIGSMLLMPTYINAALVVFLLFLLVLTLAQVRRHFMTWSFKGAIFGIFLGFLLALILEGFLIIGGRTAITEVIGWKNAPKPVSIALDAGREKLIQVLGASTKIPFSNAMGDEVGEIIKLFNNLSSEKKEEVKSGICR